MVMLSYSSAGPSGAGSAQRSAHSATLKHGRGQLVIRASTVEPQRFKPTGALSGPPLIDRRQLLLGTAAASLTLFGCPCPICKPGVGAAQASNFGYAEDAPGPSRWSGVCTMGNRQSPINIPLSTTRGRTDLGEFAFKYGTVDEPVVTNTGHGTMQVNFPAGSIASLMGRQFELVQFHFHAPSEHVLDGQRNAMEAHLVHRNVDIGGLAVLGIMIQPGGLQPNPTLATALASAPREPGIKELAVKPIDPLLLLPPLEHRAFLHYGGSLTTPPCSEGVDWYVFTQPIKVPDSQIQAFRHYIADTTPFSSNARPLQPFNERWLEYEI